MEILNTEIRKITARFISAHKVLSATNSASNCLLEFSNSLRTSTKLFEHRRGISLEIAEDLGVDLTGILSDILSEETITRIQSLFDVKGKGNYFVAIYGKPGRGNEWGFSIDGPLLSLNFTFKGEDFSAVPMLIGNYNPDTSTTDVKDNPMITEIGIPSDFMSMLDEEQLKKVVVSPIAPKDLIYSYSDKLSIIPAGMSLDQINTDDQKFFLGMILSVYLTRLKPSMANSFNTKFLSQRTNNYKLAWKGGLKMTDNFYYSISSTKMIIEFIKLHEGNSDIITVMREKEYDYGMKL